MGFLYVYIYILHIVGHTTQPNTMPRMTYQKDDGPDVPDGRRQDKRLILYVPIETWLRGEDVRVAAELRCKHLEIDINMYIIYE